MTHSSMTAALLVSLLVAGIGSANDTIELADQTRSACLDILRESLHSDEFWPAMHAAEALTLSGHAEEVRTFLKPKLSTEKDDQKRCGIARELVRAGDEDGTAVLLAVLGSKNPHGHTHAAESLYKVVRIGDGTLLDQAMRQSADSKLQLMAAAALARLADDEALELIRERLENGDPGTQRIAAWIIGRIGNSSDIPQLRKNMKSATDPMVICYHEHALAALGDETGLQALQNNLKSDDPAIRTYAATFAGDARATTAKADLIELLDDNNTDGRVRAAQSLLVLSQPSHLIPPEGFELFFNGKDLSNLQRVNTAPTTWKVRDQMIICDGKPIGEIRTRKMYQNFILELEWRHMVPRGNAGVFVWADDITSKGVPFHRGIEVQVLENAYGNTRSYTPHGDIFPIHGADMTPINGRGGKRAFPTEERASPSPGWNHYRIECRDGSISLAVNGKVVTQGKNASPRKGYICLESEGGVVHYRNLFIKELPATPIELEHVAIADRGYHSLYNGVNLHGWNAAEGWTPNDWVLQFADTDASSGELVSDKTFSNFGFLFDVRRKTDESKLQLLFPTGSNGVLLGGTEDADVRLSSTGTWDRIEGTVSGGRLTLSVNGENVVASQPVSSAEKIPLIFSADGALDLANIYVRSLSTSGR